MTDSRNPDEIIQEALSLDGTTDSLTSFYAKWARFYDEDVENEAYTAPQICVELLEKHTGQRAQDVTLLDAGCGTGLIGEVAHEKGFLRIDGFDLSHEMVDEAQKRGVYQELVGGVNLNQPLTHLGAKKYDAVICCGVFTLGHVPPSSLTQLFDSTKGGGIVIASTRTRYYDDSDYQQVSDDFVADGRVTLVELLRNGPYTADDESHYWVYKVLR